MKSDEEIFGEALELPAANRAAFLEHACAGDAARHRRLAELVANIEEADQFLAAPIAPRPVLSTEDRPGDRIGCYKLLQKIGEGGCGIVFMAEQLEPLRRHVALKVIKLGMDTKAVIARFEAERQALALMDHPNIARVFDAGATATGRPYFVMELVRGVPITRFCDEKNLTTRQRLEVFVEVCHALEHAHRRGIVHRDIKPSNILVTLHDDVIVPKVIDFGIAKAAQGRLTDQTLFTAFEQFIGTPVYMSPEQAQMNALEVDARSDIYSLGVLLYELLAGRPPFDPQTLQRAGLDEIRRIVRESDPPRPSTRLSTLTDADRVTIARLRNTAPAQLSLLLRGDLDWIVMKALEKNRIRRYDTASGFAEDIRRHLAHEPVAARPPGLAYRTQKLVRRRRALFATAAVASVLLAAGVLASAWQARRAARAEREKEALLATQAAVARGAKERAYQRAVATAEEARRFVAALQQNFHTSQPPFDREAEVERRAASVVAYYDRLPAAERSNATESRRTLALARQGWATRLSREGTAGQALDFALANFERLIAAGDDTEATAIGLAMTLQAHAASVAYTATNIDFPAALQRAEALLRPRATAPGASVVVRHHFAELIYARLERERGIRSEQRRALLEEARGLLAAAGGTDATQTELAASYARITAALGACFAWSDAERFYNEALHLADQVLARTPGDYTALRTKAFVQLALARFKRMRIGPDLYLEWTRSADRCWWECLRRDRSNNDAWYGFYLARQRFASALRDQGRQGEAIAELRALAEEGKARPNSSHQLRTIWQWIAAHEAERGQFAAAEEARRAREQATIPMGYNMANGSSRMNEFRPVLFNASDDRALRFYAGDYAAVASDAAEKLETLAALLRQPQSTSADVVGSEYPAEITRQQLAEANMMLGRYAAAEAVWQPAGKPVGSAVRADTSSRRPWLALAIARQGRGAEALDLLAPVLEELRARMKVDPYPSLEQRETFSRALLAHAIAQPATAEGRAQAVISLDEAARTLEPLSAEAKQLHDERALLAWIAEERAKLLAN